MQAARASMRPAPTCLHYYWILTYDGGVMAFTVVIFSCSKGSLAMDTALAYLNPAGLLSRLKSKGD